MAARKAPAPSFDQTMQDLEQIVQQLEQGELPLEEAIKQFEQGIALVHSGQQALAQAEQKVQILLDGQTLAPFTPEAGEE